MKREKELSLVMEEVKKLTSDSSYSDLEDAIKRGLKNIRVAKYEERQLNKAKYEKWKKRKKKQKENLR